MTVLQAVLLGVIQGLTELLPVSSSAHLVIARSFMPNFNQPGVLFDAVLHMGTLLSVIYFFRKDITAMISSILPTGAGAASASGQKKTYRKLIFLLVISTFITAAVGLLFKEEIEGLYSSVKISLLMLCVTGIILFLSDKVKYASRKEGNVSVIDACLIGFVQSIALIPGISRSGSTIACGIFLGLTRETAARYSFLLSIPAILGAVVLQSRHFSAITQNDILPYALGFAAAAVTGFLSLQMLYFIIKRARLRFFAYYCWLLSGSVMFFLWYK
ncbi:MAG: undecaprenyl-diphosphate phosphatase [Syntrophobacterales bacterium]|jgi:undecaprenyl-diphosphatase|nr:undecaprenyl-diphosphate phosphatase [Syntrophobacterales bacterium]